MSTVLTRAPDNCRTRRSHIPAAELRRFIISLPGIGVYHQETSNGPWPVFYNQHTMHDYMKSSYIFINGRKVRLAKPCLSSFLDGNLLPMHGWFHPVYGNITVDDGAKPFLDPDIVWSSLINGILDHDVAPHLSDLHLEAFNYFSEQFPSEISFSEFIQGLIEAKALLPSIEGSIGKTLAGGYLNYEFGWRNLIQDLGNLSTLLDSVRNRLNYLHRTSGIPQRLGFNRKIDLSTKVGHTLDYAISGNWGTRLRIQSINCEYRAVGWILQNLEFLDGLYGIIRGVISALELDNPLKAFWNVLPFSFVVDWFGKFSEHLTALSRVKSPNWDVYNVTHSVKTTFSLEVCDVHNLSGDSHFDDPSYEEYHTGTIDGTTYYRGLGTPFDPIGIDLDQLTPQQLVLLLAMLGTA